LTLQQQIHQLNLKYQTQVSDQKIYRIIECESHGQQSARNYHAVVGVDVGLFQLNIHYHLSRAASMGFNIYTSQGNLEYGFVLLKESNTKPWSWSRSCWDVDNEK
jgi:hypothetical protein